MRYDPISRQFRVLEGGGKGSAPASPDYAGAAATQAASSKEVNASQTWANRPTVNTPWGTINWGTGSTTDPGTGQPVTVWTQNFNLDDEANAALDSQQRVGLGRSQAAEGLLGQATEAFNTPFNWAGAPAAGTMDGYDPNTVRQNSEDALYQRQVNRIEPMLTQQEAARRTRLANMGISPEGGSEAWNRAQQSMDATREAAYENARLNAITGGGQEAQRELTMRTGAAGEADRERQRFIAEEALRRGMTLNELNALLTGQQVSMPQMPAGPNSTAGAAQPLQALTAAQAQGNFNAANANQGSDWGSAIGGIASVAGAIAPYAMAASDCRLKSNIRRIGTHARGVGIYSYTIFGRPEIGVIAQELLQVAPELVHTHPSGFLMVNYGGL